MAGTGGNADYGGFRVVGRVVTFEGEDEAAAGDLKVFILIPGWRVVSIGNFQIFTHGTKVIVLKSC